MDIQRRDFLKKSSLITLAAFIPAGLSATKEFKELIMPRQTSFLIKDAEILSLDPSIGDLPKASVLVEHCVISRIGDLLN